MVAVASWQQKNKEIKTNVRKPEFQAKPMCGCVCYLNNFIGEFITNFVGIPFWPMWQIKDIWFPRLCHHLLLSPHLGASFWPGAHARNKLAQNKQTLKRSMITDHRSPIYSILWWVVREPREAAKIETICNRYLILGLPFGISSVSIYRVEGKQRTNFKWPDGLHELNLPGNVCIGNSNTLYVNFQVYKSSVFNTNLGNKEPYPFQSEAHGMGLVTSLEVKDFKFPIESSYIQWNIAIITYVLPNRNIN